MVYFEAHKTTYLIYIVLRHESSGKQTGCSKVQLYERTHIHVHLSLAATNTAVVSKAREAPADLEIHARQILPRVLWREQPLIVLMISNTRSTVLDTKRRSRTYISGGGSERQRREHTSTPSEIYGFKILSLF